MKSPYTQTALTNPSPHRQMIMCSVPPLVVVVLGLGVAVYLKRRTGSVPATLDLSTPNKSASVNRPQGLAGRVVS